MWMLGSSFSYSALHFILLFFLTCPLNSLPPYGTLPRRLGKCLILGTWATTHFASSAAKRPGPWRRQDRGGCRDIGLAKSRWEGAWCGEPGNITPPSSLALSSGTTKGDWLEPTVMVHRAKKVRCTGVGVQDSELSAKQRCGPSLESARDIQWARSRPIMISQASQVA